MSRAPLLLFLVAGCSFSSPNGTPPDGDVPVVDEGVPCVPWRTRGGHVQDVCIAPPGGASWLVDGTGGTYDTTDGSFTGGGAPTGALVDMSSGLKMRLVSVESFQVSSGATLRVVGMYPLLVLSASTIGINGILDVSSSRAGGRGAGANLDGCQLQYDGAGGADAGGGGGGGYGVGGAAGGTGSTGAAMHAGGMGSGSIQRFQFVVGSGCHGGNGGSGASAASGGDGGGGIQLTAQASITIAGTINAGGMGGEGALASGGGGGGGSGGYIGLDAPRVTAAATAKLAANGGGGGAGCQGASNMPATAAGEDGRADNTAAAAGAAAGCMNNGRDGGTGSVRSMSGAGTGMPNTSGDGGGGGGGGGFGFVVVWTPSAADFDTKPGAVVTPRETLITGFETKP